MDLSECAGTIFSQIGFRRCMICLISFVFDRNDSSSSDLSQRALESTKYCSPVGRNCRSKVSSRKVKGKLR